MENAVTRSTVAVIVAFSALLTVTCMHEPPEATEVQPNGLPAGATYIPPSPQRMDGDPQAGYNYLVYGDYMNSGIPYEAYINVIGEDHRNLLNRTGDNAVLNYEITAVTHPNGTRVVAQNCLKCHADRINGEFTVGLGAASYDYTFDYSQLEPATTEVIRLVYGTDSPEWEAYQQFRLSGRAIGPYLVTEVRGVNPADKIWTILAAHRDKWNLNWDDDPQNAIDPQLVPTDVPPWWHLKKKHAMFYSTYGRGDFSRIMMASSMLTLDDSTTARQVDGRFKDVFAYLRTIEPPEWPWEVDLPLAETGREIFNAECAICHGTYGEAETYPNLLVSLNRIGTDPALAYSYLENENFVNWFNSGWFGQEPNSARLETHAGYIAPPLDGIWATAPYLHNGSVPTLEDVLNSTERPVYWRRTFNTAHYDREKVGWEYQEKDSKVDSKTYDTTLPGYGNGGHTFGDHLTGDQRSALLEYLKTL